MSTAAEPRPTALRRQVARAVRWNALVPLRIAASSLASLALLNGLSPQAFGLVALVTSVAGLIGTWIDLGIERSLPKFYPEIERDAGRPGLVRFMREVVLLKVGLLLAVTVAMLAAREPFFAFWAGRANDPAARAQLDADRWWLFGGLVALLILGSIFDVLMQVLVAFFRLKAFNLIGLITALLQPLLLIAAVRLDLGLPGIVAALVLVPAIAIGLAGGSSLAALNAARPAAGAGLTPGFYGRLTRYSLTNYGQQLAGQVTSVAFGVIFLDSLLAVALFKAGFTLAGQVLQVLFAPLSGIQVPLFARLREEHSPARTREAYALLSRFLLLFFLPAAAGLAVLAPNLTRILFPAEYDAAVPITVTMTVCLFSASLVAPARNVALVHEVYRPILLSRLVGLIAIPLLFWLPGQYGPLGAALAIGGAHLLAEIVAWQMAMRAVGLRYPWAFAARVVVAGAAMIAVIWPLAVWLLPVPVGLSPAERAGPALAGQLAIAGLGALVYLVSLRLLGGLDPADKIAAASLRLPGARYLLRLL